MDDAALTLEENYVLFPRALGERPAEAHPHEEGGPR